MTPSIKQNILEQLHHLQNLDEDWDGYGAPKISITAINNCRSVINQLSFDAIQDADVTPSEFGGVQLELKKDNTTINCDFGSQTFSYYVEKNGDKTEYHSFLDYTELNIKKLASEL